MVTTARGLLMLNPRQMLSLSLMPVFCMEPMDMEILPMVTTARGLLMLSLRLMPMLVSCTVPMDMVDMLDMDTLPTPTDMPVPMDMDTHILMVPTLIMDKKLP